MSDEVPANDQPSSGSKLMPILLVMTLANTGLLAWMMVRAGGASAPPDATAVVEEAATASADGAAAAPEQGSGPLHKLDEFTVQLRNPEFDRYLRISFEVGLARSEDISVVKAKTPEIRDAFIAYLSDRSYEELRGSQGLARVKGALAQRLQSIVPDERVKALYITNFVVQ